MIGDNLKFQMQNIEVDMGTTSFENMFLNTYVQMADGDFLKVYLLIYKDAISNGQVDIEKIRRQLNFDDEKMQDALTYWLNMGLFRQKEQNDGEKYIEIISLRQAYFGHTSENSSMGKATIDKSERKSVMFDNVERIINRQLTPQDITRIQETIEEYKSDPELVTEAFRQAKEAGNVDVKYVMGFLKTWRDQNIHSLNDLKINEERKKLLRQKSPRQYRKKADTSFTKSSTSSYSQKAREERLKKLKEKGMRYDS